MLLHIGKRRKLCEVQREVLLSKKKRLQGNFLPILFFQDRGLRAVTQTDKKLKTPNQDWHLVPNFHQ